MFFYLLRNSSFLKEDINENKNIKIMIYGSLSYIICHAIILSAIPDIQSYFWLVLILDCLTMYLIYTTSKNGDVRMKAGAGADAATTSAVALGADYDSEVEVDAIIEQFNKNL
jgi:hypothetical protein